MSNLSIPELFKYEWRIEHFIKKYSAGEKFKLINGRLVNLQISREIISLLKKRNRVGLNRLTLNAIDGKPIKWAELKKTEEFGGTVKFQHQPFVPVNYKEAQAFIGLRNQIEDIKNKLGSPTVPIKVGNTVFDVFGVEKTPGVPKSDFHFIDVQGQPIAWISHKDGQTPMDFQQWGGISESREPLIHSSIEVKRFIKSIQKMYPDGLPEKSFITKPIRSRKLKAQAIYGSSFGSSFSINNVNLAIQGEIRLKSWDRKTYIIQAIHILVNGKIPVDGYEPVLAVTYRKDRHENNIDNARFGIFPRDSQKSTEILPI